MANVAYSTNTYYQCARVFFFFFFFFLIFYNNARYDVKRIALVYVVSYVRDQFIFAKFSSTVYVYSPSYFISQPFTFHQLSLVSIFFPPSLLLFIRLKFVGEKYAFLVIDEAR